MKIPQVRLKETYHFENLFGEIIEIKKGTILSEVDGGAYEKVGEKSVIWKCGAGSQDYTIVRIPSNFLAPYNPHAIAAAIRHKNNK